VLIDRGHMVDVVLEEVTFCGAHHVPIICPIIRITRGMIRGNGVAALLGPPPIRVFAPASFFGLGIPGLGEGSRDCLNDLIHLPCCLPLPAQEGLQRLKDLAQVGLLLISFHLDRPVGDRDLRVWARQRNPKRGVIRCPSKVRVDLVFRREGNLCWNKHEVDDGRCQILVVWEMGGALLHGQGEGQPEHVAHHHQVVCMYAHFRPIGVPGSMPDVKVPTHQVEPWQCN
jgi:hypothetical protein